MTNKELQEALSKLPPDFRVDIVLIEDDENGNEILVSHDIGQVVIDADDKSSINICNYIDEA